ncbi:MAG: hypothetical protein ACLRMX_03625 [Lachnospira eligens]
MDRLSKSDNDGDDMEYIDITYGLSFVIYNSESYTQLELEEIAVLKGCNCKKEAMRRQQRLKCLNLL